MGEQIQSNEENYPYELPDNYELERTEADDTGVRLFTLKDKNTGVETSLAEFNEDVDVHTLMAWVGARTSRSMEDYPDIYREVYGAQNASEKLATVFVKYGHASVADMSPVMVFMNKIPMHEAFWMFNHTSTGGGQETSTRYVEMDNPGITPVEQLIDTSEVSREQLEELQEKWEQVQTHGSEMYYKWTPKLEEALRDYLERNTEEGTKIPNSTVTARTLDVSRYWLPAGAETSMTMLTSTRTWVDMISQLRSTGNVQHEQLGDQLHTLLRLKDYEGAEDLQAEMSALTKYSEGKDTLTNNLAELATMLENDEEFTRLSSIDKSPLSHETNVDLLEISDFENYGEQLALQYISTLYPEMDERAILHYLENLDEDDKSEMGRIMLQEHMHHNLMRNPGDVRGPVFVLETAQAYLRDLNRHRAAGRLIPALEGHNMDAAVYAGFNDNFQMEHAEYLQPHKEEWTADMERHYKYIYEAYEQLKEVSEDAAHHIINVLPLGHQMKMHMSEPVTQLNYMTSLRVSLGGDYGYRSTVYEMLDKLRDDPYLGNMLPHIEAPDPNNVQEILGRS